MDANEGYKCRREIGVDKRYEYEYRRWVWVKEMTVDEEMNVY